jgi:D-proline reductase (dithiol) PrdB
MQPDQLPLWERTLIAAYRWRRVDPVPLARLGKRIDQCRVALVTTAGLVASGEPPFDLARRGGDTSFRMLDATTPASDLRVVHRSNAFDRQAVERDVNVACPIEPLGELAAGGVIGSVAARHLSFMGSITAPGRLQRETAVAAADVLVDDAVDIALLAPV